MEQAIEHIHTHEHSATVHDLSAYARLDRMDPTRTTYLQQAFIRELKKRFRALRGEIRRMIVDEDCFGLMKRSQEFKITAMTRFAFPRNADKIDGFMDWLRTREEAGILQTGKIRQIGAPIEKAWTDVYIVDSYKRGIIRSREELRKAGFSVPSLEATGGIEAAMSGPFHADRVGVLATRAFDGLKGITNAMDHQISQVLAQGMIDGDGPITLARKLTRTISGPVGDLGITDTLGRFIPAERRAKMLARTEIIRAHHQGNIQEMRNWAVEGVKVKAEWATGGDPCEECSSLEGKVFTLDEIQSMIPLHPSCKCVAIPVKIGEEVK